MKDGGVCDDGASKRHPRQKECDWVRSSAYL